MLLLLLLLFLSFDGEEEEEDTRRKQPLIWGTPPPPLLPMVIFLRGEHRALLLQKQQRRENKFVVVFLVVVVVVASITFAPLKFLPQNNSRIFLSLLFVTSLESNYEQGREWRKREKKYTNTRIVSIKERFEIRHTRTRCLSYGATIASTRRKRDARVCAEVLCAIRYILNPF